jgi:alpha,alpha-trehalose phosphorylase (configuration-retaining)
MAIANILDKFYNPSISLPHSEEYGAVESIGSSLIITHTSRGEVKVRKINLDNVEDIEEIVKKEVGKIFDSKHKLVATSFDEKESYKKLAPKLWLDEDIVSFLAEDKKTGETIKVVEDLKILSSYFDSDNTAKVPVAKDYEVVVKDLVTLEDYKKTCSSEEFYTLTRCADAFKGNKLIFLSATPQGGGVALMRHAMIRLLRLLDLDVKWYVLKPDLEAFNITKRKFHNVLQNVAPPGTKLNEDDKKIYNDWISINAEIFENKFKRVDVIVIDDPQPSGLIPYIKKANPNVKIIYRSHIQIVAKLANKKGTAQNTTWEFLWKNIKKADLFVAHPMPDFVPKSIDRNKLLYMPATTDPLDGLNKPLDQKHMKYYMELFNKFAKADGATPLDLRRPFIIQIARFDPSKGIPHVLDSYLKLRVIMKRSGKNAPQLIITGNGSVDDPDRAPIFEETIKTIAGPEFEGFRDDIKVVRLPHIDQLLNTLLRKSHVALQLSTKEGFEIKITEALMKGKPVIVFRAGGMPLQVMDGFNGFVVEVGDDDDVARHLYDLFTDQKLYEKMSEKALKLYDRSLLTIPNATRWLNISLNLLRAK